MDTRAGAIITALQHIQLPPIMHPEQVVDNRHRGDRPLPIEPFATREPYVTAGSTTTTTGGHYQQQQDYVSTLSSGATTGQQTAQQLSSASALAAAEQKRNQEFNEHLRKSLTGDNQRSCNGNGNSSNSNDGVNTGGKLLLPSSSSSGQALTQDTKGVLLALSTSQGSSNGVLGSTMQNGNLSLVNSTGRPYPPILPWTDDIEQPLGGIIPIPKIQSSPPPTPLPSGTGSAANGSTKGQKVRRKWTDQETKDLLTGCSMVSVHIEDQ